MQKKMLSEETSLAKTSGYGALFFDLNILFNIFNILIFSIHKSTEETSLAKTSGYGALFFDLNILIFLTF